MRKRAFLWSNVYMQIILDIEKYLEHYTDQKGYYALVPGPFAAENAAFPGHLLSSLQTNIHPLRSHLAQANKCTIESTPGSEYVYLHVLYIVRIICLLIG